MAKQTWAELKKLGWRVEDQGYDTRSDAANIASEYRSGRSGAKYRVIPHPEPGRHDYAIIAVPGPKKAELATGLVVFQGSKRKEITPAEAKDAVAWKEGKVYAVILGERDDRTVWYTGTYPRPYGVDMATGTGAVQLSQVRVHGKKMPTTAEALAIIRTGKHPAGGKAPGGSRAGGPKPPRMKTASRKRGRVYETPAKGGKMLSRRPVRGA